jgi:Helix-turn-helix domain
MTMSDERERGRDADPIRCPTCGTVVPVARSHIPGDMTSYDGRPAIDVALRVEQVATLFKVDCETVRRWRRAGRFPNAGRVARKAGWRIPWSDIRKLAAFQPWVRQVLGELERAALTEADAYVEQKRAESAKHMARNGYYWPGESPACEPTWRRLGFEIALRRLLPSTEKRVLFVPGGICVTNVERVP